MPIAFYILMPVSILAVFGLVLVAGKILLDPAISKAVKIVVVLLTVVVESALITTIMFKVPQMWG